jgi:hypothetical protein
LRRIPFIVPFFVHLLRAFFQAAKFMIICVRIFTLKHFNVVLVTNDFPLPVKTRVLVASDFLLPVKTRVLVASDFPLPVKTRVLVAIITPRVIKTCRFAPRFSSVQVCDATKA